MLTLIVGYLVSLAGQAVPPSSAPRWSLQVEPAHCVLERQSPETGAALSIDTTPGSDSYRVVITGDGLNGSAALKPASLTFAPSQNSTKGLARVVKLSSGAKAIVMQGVSPAILSDLSGASTVTLEIEKGGKSVVPITKSAQAVDALRKCNADQLVAWGADPAQFLPGGTLPVALKSRDEWIPNANLLKLAGQSKRSSIDDNFRLLLAADGTIAGCHATADMTEPDLEKATCAVLVGRRLFSPAKDASGTAVAGAASFTLSLIRYER